MIGKRVEYQTDWGSYGIGIITQVDEETGTVRVKDDEDGSAWEGSAELVEIWDDATQESGDSSLAAQSHRRKLKP